MNEDRDRYETIHSFHERFLEVLCTVMHSAGAKIECDSQGSQQK